jgi:CRISPR type I-F-associated protein Csy2
MRYLLLEDIQVGDLNAEGNSLTAGASILPTGVCGFGHWLQRQCPELGEVEAVAVAVHEFQMQPGMTRNPMALHGFARDKILNPPIVQELKADARLSLLLRHAVTAARLGEGPESVEAALRRRLPGASLCGGRCHRIGAIAAYEENADEVFLHSGAKRDLQALQRRLRGWRPRNLDGWFLKDRADLIRDYNQSRAESGLPRDDLAAVLDALALYVGRDGEGKPLSYRRAQLGWIAPLAIGFQAIESPNHERPGRRDPSFPHAYAEPMTGLGEFIGCARSARGELLDPGGGFFWRYRHNPATATFYVTAY